MGALPLVVLEAALVKVKLGKIRNGLFLESLQKAMKMEGVPVAASFKLRKIAKQIGNEVEHFDEENEKLLKQFCEVEGDRPKLVKVDEKVSTYVFKDGCRAKYEPQYKKLCAIEVELPTISPDDFGEAIAKFLPEDLFQLEFIDYGEAK